MLSKNIHAAWVVNIKSGYSHKHQERFYTIEMVDDASGNYVKTYIGEFNRNIVLWEPIIETWDDTTAICITGKFKTKKGKEGDCLINADCVPKAVERMSRDDFLNAYYEHYYA